MSPLRKPLEVADALFGALATRALRPVRAILDPAESPDAAAEHLRGLALALLVLDALLSFALLAAVAVAAAARPPEAFPLRACSIAHTVVCAVCASVGAVLWARICHFKRRPAPTRYRVEGYVPPADWAFDFGGGGRGTTTTGEGADARILSPAASFYSAEPKTAAAAAADGDDDDGDVRRNSSGFQRATGAVELDGGQGVDLGATVRAGPYAPFQGQQRQRHHQQQQRFSSAATHDQDPPYRAVSEDDLGSYAPFRNSAISHQASRPRPSSPEAVPPSASARHHHRHHHHHASSESRAPPPSPARSDMSTRSSSSRRRPSWAVSDRTGSGSGSGSERSEMDELDIFGRRSQDSSRRRQQQRKQSAQMTQRDARRYVKLMEGGGGGGGSGSGGGADRRQASFRATVEDAASPP